MNTFKDFLKFIGPYYGISILLGFILALTAIVIGE